MTQRRKPRLDARRKIIDAANVIRHQLGQATLKPYGSRQIQQAVRCVRHYGLVSDETLVAAGYRVPHNPRLET